MCHLRTFHYCSNIIASYTVIVFGCVQLDFVDWFINCNYISVLIAFWLTLIVAVTDICVLKLSARCVAFIKTADFNFEFLFLFYFYPNSYLQWRISIA